MTDVQQIDTSAVDAGSNGGARPNGKAAIAPVSAAPVETSRPPAPPRVDKRDPRYLALRNFAISMSVFNILGYAVLGFEQPWTWPLFAVAVGYAVELTAETLAAWAGRRAPGYSGHGMWGLYTFLLPTHITALAVNGGGLAPQADHGDLPSRLRYHPTLWGYLSTRLTKGVR